MSNVDVPFLDLVTPHRELEEQLVEVLRRSLQTAAFVGGAQVEGFEREFAEYCGTTYCVGVGSGTDAVRFALIGAGVGSGDAVLTVSHTFIATVEGITQAGAGTEFVDIDEDTYTMSPAALLDYLRGCHIDPDTGRPLGRRTGKPLKALLPVHLYGQCADMEPLLRIAEDFGLLLIEDACQAHGSEYRLDGTWRRAGTFGKAAAFSFYPGKNLGACGEAGAITTNDPEVARCARMLRDHGQARKYFHELEGYNGRLDAIQAGFLRAKLPHLDAWNAARRDAAARYFELLEPLTDVGVITPKVPDDRKPIYHLYVIRTKERDALAEHLAAHGIHTGLHYPVPVHLQNCYRSWGYNTGSLPVTERVAAEILSLPMFPTLSPDQQAVVAGAIRTFSAAPVAH